LNEQESKIQDLTTSKQQLSDKHDALETQITDLSEQKTQLEEDLSELTTEKQWKEAQ